MNEEKREKIAWLLVRIGVAFAFLYAGISGFIDPEAWIGWFPKFMREIVPGNILLPVWGIYEIATALWLLYGKKIFIPSLVASFSFAGLIIFNLDAIDVIFRDITILFSIIALTIYSYKRD